MNKNVIKLKDIPEALLPFINLNTDARSGHNVQAYYNGRPIESIFLFRGMYRTYTKGEYRLDGDTEIEIY